jgi:predicted XRE-type DNA-binding protein
VDFSASITESGGNVFADLGFEPAEAAILEMRARLMSDLREYIRSSGMTPAQAARKLKIGRTRLSDLTRGRWQEFSLEMLITLAARVGCKVRLELAA